MEVEPFLREQPGDRSDGEPGARLSARALRSIHEQLRNAGARYGSVHFWLAPPLQSQISNCVPSVVLLPGSSRHRPDCGFTSEPFDWACQTWAQYFRQSIISTWRNRSS